jgi:hypothetical protein
MLRRRETYICANFVNAFAMKINDAHRANDVRQSCFLIVPLEQPTIFTIVLAEDTESSMAIGKPCTSTTDVR